MFGCGGDDLRPRALNLSVEGHTDDRGTNAANLKLSQGRTDSVVLWLTQHGGAVTPASND